MDRSISNNASIRRTTSIAMDESGISFLPWALAPGVQAITPLVINKLHTHTRHAAVLES
jgi:hypothetical protein